MKIFSFAPRTSITFTALTGLTALAIGTGCSTAPEELDEDGLSLRDTASGGPIYNTNLIDTSDVPAIDTKGLTLDGVDLVTVSVVQGGSLTPLDPGSLFVEEGVVKGTVDGVAVEGVDFIDSQWRMKVNDGPVVTATLVDVESSADAGLFDPFDDAGAYNPRFGDLRLLDPQRLVYTFTYFQGKRPIGTCAYDSVGGARAVLYGDLHVDHESGDVSARDNTVYFGCISGAVGKAALHGYAPDSPSLPSVTLAEFESSIRALRADYCGDGGSFTEVGNPLTYQDHYGIHSHTEPKYSTEAVWEVGGGAACVNRVRKTGKTPINPLGIDCGDDRFIGPCGGEADAQELWDMGAYLWTKLP